MSMSTARPLPESIVPVLIVGGLVVSLVGLLVSPVVELLVEGLVN